MFLLHYLSAEKTVVFLLESLRKVVMIEVCVGGDA